MLEMNEIDRGECQNDRQHEAHDRASRRTDLQEEVTIFIEKGEPCNITK